MFKAFLSQTLMTSKEQPTLLYFY